MLFLWLAFIVFILALLALDLGVFHRRPHVVSVREALLWTTAWIALGLSFAVFVYWGYEGHWLGLGTAPDVAEKSTEFPEGRGNDGRAAVIKYLTGYLVEKSLSVDNVFVIAMLFGFFAVPRMYQHRVLYWGVLGALVLRGAMIALGAQLIARFSFILYVFGILLLLTALKMLLLKTERHDPSRNVVIRLARRFFPVTERFHGEHFLVRAGSSASHERETPRASPVKDEAVQETPKGALMLTPLAVALIAVETTDLVFAVDSIPAIFGITADPFLVFTSNVFAILGLRSLYFALAEALAAFAYLRVSLAVVLAVVGLKMLAHLSIDAWLGPNADFYLLGLVLLVLGAGVAASLVVRPRRPGFSVSSLVHDRRKGPAARGEGWRRP
jgi:tellurite resistance protein TerC